MEERRTEEGKEKQEIENKEERDEEWKRGWMEEVESKEKREYEKNNRQNKGTELKSTLR